MIVIQRRATLLLLVLAVLAGSAPRPADACLWDTDTLEQERQRFPTILELIAGKFNRHSDAYYRWRIEDRTAKLAERLDHDRYLDDLAVAHDKLGNHDRAIEIATDQLQRNPDRYETLANLGTFHFHAGNLVRGLPYIDRALDVNPDAHFGRERIQKYLVEYILQRMREEGSDIVPLPLWAADEVDWFSGESPLVESSQARRVDGRSVTVDRETLERLGYTYTTPVGSFAAFLVLRDVSRADAIKGVAGMMRFGNPDSPVLLETLGHLLLTGMARPSGADANRLAGRCFLKAARHCPAGATATYQSWGHRWGAQDQSVSELETDFAAELAEGDAWMKQIRRDEKAWIEAGLDVDARYAEKYYRDPELPHPPFWETWFAGYAGQIRLLLLFVSVGVLAVAIVLWIYLRRRRRRAEERRRGFATAHSP